MGIFTLGIVLGTLFLITRNLWYNIFFHFLNNTMALMAAYYANKYDMLKKLADDEYKVTVTAALISLVITVGLFLVIRKKASHQSITMPSRTAAQFDIE